MYYVYILVSIKYPDKIYIGFTNNIERRLGEHNKSSNDGYTKKYSPWEVRTYIAFSNSNKARDFEKYLKKGSGFAFMKKRFL